MTNPRTAGIRFALVAGVAASGVQAADRPEITFAGGRIFPESVTSTKEGTLYFGSLGQDSVYRATSKSAKAETWIQPKSVLWRGLAFVRPRVGLRPGARRRIGGGEDNQPRSGTRSEDTDGATGLRQTIQARDGLHPIRD